MVTLSPRSTASSRSEKCRDASVAVMLFMQTGYLIIRFSSIGLVARLAGIAGAGKDDESAHNPDVAGSNPAPATNKEAPGHRSLNPTSDQALCLVASRDSGDQPPRRGWRPVDSGGLLASLLPGCVNPEVGSADRCAPRQFA